MRGLYLNAEKDDGYIRDLSVFGDGINIEDTMSVLVRYKNQALSPTHSMHTCPGKATASASTGHKVA